MQTSKTAALSSLYHSYFVCAYQTSKSTVIEYGKAPYDSKDGDVYLALIDTDNPLKVRFFGFGNKEEDVVIFNIGTTPHHQMKIKCKGNSLAAVYLDLKTKICVPRCHEMCEPLKGKFGFIDNAYFC